MDWKGRPRGGLLHSERVDQRVVPAQVAGDKVAVGMAGEGGVEPAHQGRVAGSQLGGFAEAGSIGMGMQCEAAASFSKCISF